MLRRNLKQMRHLIRQQALQQYQPMLQKKQLKQLQKLRPHNPQQPPLRLPSGYPNCRVVGKRKVLLLAHCWQRVFSPPQGLCLKVLPVFLQNYPVPARLLSLQLRQYWHQLIPTRRPHYQYQTS